jgi:DNA-binding response OmpR family regulator
MHAETDRKVHPIVLFSPNMELCVSIQLALENKYEIMATTDGDVLMMLVKSFEPDLIILNAPLTPGLDRLHARLKAADPGTRILLCSSRPSDIGITGDDRHFVDGVLTGPWSIERLTDKIRALLHE